MAAGRCACVCKDEDWAGKAESGFLEQLELWAAIKYRIWEEGRDQEGEGTRKVPKSEYASYLERRAAALKAKGLTGFETDIPENL